MPSYKIAELIVNMTPRYEKMKKLLKAYEISCTDNADITIKCTDEFLRQKQKENAHLTMSDIENIFTLSEFSAEIIDFDGMVFHASAIEFDGGAYLFSAGSKVGKSTHTSLWQEYFGTERVRIINDDKPVIRNMSGDFFVYGTPWCGASYKNTNIKVPLKAVIFLERSKDNWICKAEDTGKIIYNIMSHTARYYNRDKAAHLMDMVEKLIDNTDIYNMGCNISLQAVELAYKKMVNSKSRRDLKI